MTSDNAYPTVIVFYGKSVLATNISRVLTKSVTWTVMDLIWKTSKWPDGETAMR